MCGIAGLFGAQDSDAVARMVESLHHRGPDGNGVVDLPGATLGHARLSLLDLSGGAQPMTRGDTTLVFNGEIYNHAVLRQQLIERGHSFNCYSDTEVVLRAYEAWGTDMFERLEGMYALALIDAEGLLLARDYFGQKPLYYAIQDNRLWFASEIKALFTVQEIPRRVDMRAMIETATFHVPLEDGSFFQDVFQVSPGTWMRVSAPVNQPLQKNTERHSRPARPSLDTNNAESLLDTLEVALEHSVAEQLMADHPVGIYLSGGVDSSLVAALAARHSDHLHTFSFADQTDHPDLVASKALAEALGTQHHVYRFSADELIEDWPKSIAALERPFPFTPVENTAARVRQHVKAVLCGDGADELFCGYIMHHHPGAWIHDCVQRYNALIRTGALQVSDCARVKAWLRRLTVKDPERQRNALNVFFLRDQLEHAHLQVWDHGSMAHGLEVRMPFLHRSVRDIALALPQEWRIHDGVRKRLLRALATRILPSSVREHIVERRKFAVPSTLGHAQGVLMARCDSLLPEGHLEHHPLRMFAANTRRVVELDLFLYIFVGHGGQLPEGLSIDTLYSDHYEGLMGVLRSIPMAAPEVSVSH